MAPSLLLDTHALLWWLVEPEKLSALAQAAINDPAAIVFVSAASSHLQQQVSSHWPCS